MASKAFLVVLGLLAIIILIASEAAARDLAETSNVTKSKSKETHTKLEKDQYGSYPGGGSGGYPGGGSGGYPGGGYPGGRQGGYHGGGGRYGGGYPGGRYGGGYCRYGCCYRGYNGCRRCCSYAGEATEAQVQNKPHN